MSNLKQKTGRILLLASVLLLSACGAPAEEAQQPTLEPNAIYTSAAETVQAQLTIAAAMTEAVQPTEAPPTAAPTNTPPALPTVGGTPALPPGATPAVPLATIATTPLAPPPPAGTPAVPLVTITPLGGAATISAPQSDKAILVSQEPQDGTTVKVNTTDVDLKWTIKNVGTTTWNTNYYILYSGISTSDRLDGTHRLPKKYSFPATVKPNETVTLAVDIDTTGIKPGKYRSSWNLWNDKGEWFFWDLYVEINVSE